MSRCRFDPQRRRVFHERINKPLRQVQRSFTGFMSSIDNLVINIGEVRNIGYFISAIFKIPADGIKRDSTARVTDVDVIVNSRAADIHPDFSRVQRRECLFFPGHCIV